MTDAELMDADSSPNQMGWRCWLKAALLIGAVVAIYAPAFNGEFLWDDNEWVTENRTLRSVHGLYQIWFEPAASPHYYPLTNTGFWVQYQLFGTRTLGYHVVTTLLHAANALLLWRLLRKLFRAKSEAGAASVSEHVPFLAAFLFAVHPMQVESVAWITEFKNTFSTLLCLASVACFLKFLRPAGPEQARARVNWSWYGLAFIFFLGALLAKSVAATLPAALLVLIWWLHGRIAAWLWLSLMPWLAAGAGIGAVTTWIEKNHVGAKGIDWSYTFVGRCLIAARALWFYALKLVWPANVSAIEPKWQVDARSPVQWLLLAACVVVPIVFWALRKKFGRGPLTAVLLFGGMLLPALGFIDFYTMLFALVCNHYQYLACVPILTALAWAIVRVIERIPVRRLRLASAALPVLVLSVVSFTLAKTYASSEALWSDTLAKNPNAWVAHYNMAQVCSERGDLAGAEYHFLQTLQLRSVYPEAHNAYGALLAQQQKLGPAELHLRAALRLQPEHVMAHSNLGIVLAMTGRLPEAVREFAHAARLDPQVALYHVNLGMALQDSGDYEAAFCELQIALQLDPASEQARFRRDAVLRALRKRRE